MVSSEAAPLAKTGGLADVVGSLPAALRALGDEVAVVVPRYGSIDPKRARRVWDRLAVYLGPARYDVAIYAAAAEYPLYLVDCPPLYDRKGFYGEAGVDYPDNHIRFAVFARAALAVARYLFRTDIFHCHDWQAGLVPAYLRTTFAGDPTFLGSKTLFTIHNLGYQGLFPKSALPEVGARPGACSAPMAWSSSAASAISRAASSSPMRSTPSAPLMRAKSRRPSTASAWMALCGPAPMSSPASSTAPITASGTPRPIL